MDGEKVVTVGVAYVEQVLAFRRLEITFFFLITLGADSQCDLEGSKGRFVIVLA